MPANNEARTTVAHCKRDRYDVLVSRPSVWGNPWSHKEGTLAKYKVATLEEALEKYDEWIRSRPDLLAALDELRGKVLGCWCRPKGGFKGKLRCHAQILAALCDGIRPEEVP